MDRWGAIVAAALLVGCSHKNDPSKTGAPAPAPVVARIDAAAAPVATEPVTVVELGSGGTYLFGAGAEGVYFAKMVERPGDLPLAPLVRRTRAGVEDVIGKSVHGVAMTDDAVYWTDPGYDGPNTGGVWRVARPAGHPEQLVSGSNLPEKIVVMGDRLVYWEGGALLAIGKDGGTPSPLATIDATVFEMVGDAGAVYWIGGTDPNDSRLGEVTRAGEAKTIAKLDGEARALAADDQRLLVGYKSPKGIKIVAFPKAGGAPTTWAEGAFEGRTVVVAGAAIVLLDEDQHALLRVASPGAAPEVLYRAPDGAILSGVVAAADTIYVGQIHADH